MSVGIGPGIYYVPLLRILGHFYMKESIPISQFLICISSFVTCISNYFSPHPKYAFRSLVDYNLAFTMMPSLFLGVYIGYYINLVSPTSVLFIILILVFIWLNYSIIKRMSKVCTEEKAVKKKDLEVNDDRTILLDKEDDETVKLDTIRIEDSKFNQQISNNFARIIALGGLTIFFFIFYSYLTGLTGNTDPIINIRGCTFIPFLSEFFFLTIMVVVNYIIIKTWKEEKEFIDKYVPAEDIQLDVWNSLFICLVGFLAGIASVCLGLGAATVTNPILMGYLDKYPPSVISATSVFLMFFVAVYGSLVYVATGNLNIQYSLVLGIFAVIGALIGSLSVKKIMKVLKSEAIIVYTVFALISIATILLLSSGIVDLIYISKHKPEKLWRFLSFCLNSTMSRFK